MEIIAHRGASADAPENTLPAVDRAVDARARFVEVDVQLTADGEVVVVHDLTLRRTTDVAEVFPGRAAMPVGDFTLGELRELDAGAWFDRSFAGTRMPTLGEVLDAVDGRCGLLVELKRPDLSPGIGQALLDVLRPRGWLPGDRGSRQLVVASFNWAVVGRLAHRAPTLPLGLLGAPVSALQLLRLASRIDYFHLADEHVDRTAVELIHEAGLATWTYTVDDPDRLRELIDLGVDGIITNRPGVARGVLSEGGAEPRSGRLAAPP